MEERFVKVQGPTTQSDPKRGILMFKDHVASMRSGSKLLGGEKDETGKAEGHSPESE